MSYQHQLQFPVYTADEAQWFDTNAISQGIPGYSIMQKAGIAAWNYICPKLPQNPDIHIFCGAGNNGGDGWIFAVQALKAGFNINVWYKPAHTPDCRRAQSAAMQTLSKDHITILSDDIQVHLETLVSASQDRPVLVVDALFGIGLNRSLEKSDQQIIAIMNAAKGMKLALDIPSGINATTGSEEGMAFKADITITFIVEKQGLFRNAGKAYSGIVHLEHLDVVTSNTSLVEQYTQFKGYRIYRDKPDIIVLKRPEYSHKGSFGTLFCVGGDQGMGGAIIIAAESAVSFGAGKVFIASHDFHNTIAVTRCPSIMAANLNHIEVDASEFIKQLEQANSLVLGPGLGQSHWALECFRACFNSGFCGNIVLDADALNLLAYNDEAYNLFFTRNANTIMTPHPKEADRLLGRFMDESILSLLNPFDKAIRISRHFNSICILKGHGTIIATPEIAFVCETGNSALAKAGQGDCLSGMIGALIAQNMNPIDAARLAVWAHGLASERWSQTESKLSLLPHETARVAARALEQEKQLNEANIDFQISQKN